MKIIATLITLAAGQPLTFQPADTADQIAQASSVFDNVNNQLVASFPDSAEEDIDEESLNASIDALNELGPEYTASLAYKLMEMESNAHMEQLAAELRSIAPDVEFGDWSANIAESMKVLENVPETDLLDMSRQMTQSIESIIGMTMEQLDELSSEDFLSLVKKIQDV